ncbi:MAG: hypothetical protein KAH00_02925 [Cocleimonas sp.]|nr:hypothetical protein [Cocleimonas sp.]
MKNTLSLLMTSLFLLGIAHAESTIVVNIDKNGNTKFVSSPKTAKEINVSVLGFSGAPTNGATTLIFEVGKKAVWTTETPDEIHKRYGGTGSPEIKLIFDDENEKKPIELFDETSSAIQPEVGLWVFSQTSMVFTKGCPQGAQAAMPAGLSSKPMKIKWANPWKPTPLFSQYPPHIKFNYQQQAPSQWKVSATMQKMPGGGMEMVQNLSLINTKKINVKASITMAMNMGGMNINCRADVDGVIKKQ